MNANGRAAPLTPDELRALAREAGIGEVAEPAPVRLDDLRREITEIQARMARLPRLLSAEAS